jgi:hypothetical protein
MKTPRLTDFDPNAKAPTLKSSLEHMPVIQKPQPTHEVKSPTLPLNSNHQEVAEEQTLVQPVPRTVPRPVPGTPYPLKGG